jgi:hypothetical protein
MRRIFDVMTQKPMRINPTRMDNVISITKLWEWVLKKEPKPGRSGIKIKCNR